MNKKQKSFRSHCFAVTLSMKCVITLRLVLCCIFFTILHLRFLIPLNGKLKYVSYFFLCLSLVDKCYEPFLFLLSGLLHISNITRARITSVGDLLSVNEKIKVLVLKSMFPDKISLRYVRTGYYCYY